MRESRSADILARIEEREKEPWEKTRGETPASYKAFRQYLEMPSPRRISDVVEALGKKPNYRQVFYKWAEKHFWYERASAYDINQQRVADEAELDAIREMRKRHVRDAVGAQRTALEALASINPTELDPNDIIKWLSEGQKMERLARGEPTEIQQQSISLLSLFEEAHDRLKERTASGNGDGDLEDVIDVEFQSGNGNGNNSSRDDGAMD